MNEEEKIISMNLGVLIEDNIDVIFTDLKKNIFKLLCKSIYITSFNIFSNLLYDEINSFIAFLKTDDIEIPCSYGKFAVSKGLDEDIIFTFLDVILYFILDHYDNLKIALKLFYRYMKYYIIAFYKEKKNKRDLSQNQLYKTLNDIIEVQQKEILEKEKEQNRQRTAFLINLAHETKLPLTILENQINMVKEEAGKRQLQTVLPLEEQIKELQEMIGNILDYEKILQGKMLYNHDIIVNLSKTVVSKVELFKVITDKMNICIRQEILGELHIRIAPLALDRILNNVLDNAIKYNHEKGSIHITVKGDDSSVFFIVRDTGIGIPLDQIQHLFEPYYQCTHKKRSNQGIGAG
ncbi:MAG: HAMP domain-containing histidine kinase, partial [Spirochaetales bacterium]|nr:HAMP domain-containing histidine kinase [Spirochaetales bacterium]